MMQECGDTGRQGHIHVRQHHGVHLYKGKTNFAFSLCSQILSPLLGDIADSGIDLPYPRSGKCRFLHGVHPIISENQSWLVRVGARPPPFTLFTITYKVAVYTPPISSLPPLCTQQSYRPASLCTTGGRTATLCRSQLYSPVRDSEFGLRSLYQTKQSTREVVIEFSVARAIIYVASNVVDRHCIDANPDPDPTQVSLMLEY